MSSHCERPAPEQARFERLNTAVLAALRSEATPALRVRLAAGWGEVIVEVRDVASALRERMRTEAAFDVALAEFAARELDDLARELRLNLNLRSAPQWPN